MTLRQKKALSLVLAILGMLLLFPLYIFFHEIGHTLVAPCKWGNHYTL